MTADPVDVLIETGIEGQRPLEPPPGRDHREGRKRAQRPTSAKTCNRRKLPIRLCQMTKFVLDRDTPATVVSLVAKASLR